MQTGSKTGQEPVYVNSQSRKMCKEEQHPGLRPPLTKSLKLASEIMSATGLVCLRVSNLAGHSGFSRVTIGGIADRDSGTRIWLKSTKSAERVIAELFRKHGMRRGGTLVIEAVPGDVDRMLRDSASLLGIEILEEERIDLLMASLTKRIEAAIKAMGRKGTRKHLRSVTERDLTGLLARQSV
jgi:hypothetical protein